MKPKYLLPLALLAVFCASAAAQTITISSKKTVYRRPKPIMDFKKSFSVTRPIAKASTPALSRKITAAISPDTVLGLNVQEEVSEIQWLEETGFETLFNNNGVLSMKLWMTGTAAYPDSLTRFVVVDLKTGNRINIANVFANPSGLAAIIKKAQKTEVEAAIKEIKSDPENKDADPEQLFESTDFKAADLKEFSVSDKGVTFYYDYGFPHVLQALQPAGEFTFAWHKLKPFVKPGGLLARFVR